MAKVKPNAIPAEVSHCFENLLLKKPYRIMHQGKIIEVYPQDHNGDHNEMMLEEKGKQGKKSSSDVVGANPTPK